MLLLLEKGADPNAQTHHEETALMWALELKETKASERILENYQELCGSKASLKPSPIRLKAIMVRKIATPGAIIK